MHSVLRSIRRFLSELRRRNVYRVALTYLAAGFVVVELADIAAGTFELPGWFGPMVWVLVGLGFPIALVLAWALEVTPEGVRVDQSEGLEGATAPDGFSPSNGVIAGLLVVAIGLLLYPRVFPSGEGSGGQPSAVADTTKIEERSVAVLPFANLSGTEEARPLARGLHDDLLTRLSNVGDLKVISRTSVEKYRDTGLSLPSIADSLGVRWIVEGGVQRSENKIQVNAQLIDPDTDVHRWADSYQRDLSAEGLFSIQGAIAGEIAEALNAKLTPEEQQRIAGAPTGNLDAYRLYVRGRRELAQRRFSYNEHLERAARYFWRAIEQDSSFALAWAGLADAASSRIRDVPDSSLIRSIDQEAAARRALELDPDLAEAHASMGHVHYVNQNAPAALRELRQAVELKPSYWEAHQMLGWVYFILDQPDQALEHFQLAVELNPQHARARHGLYDAYDMTGQPRKALREARRQQRMGLEETSAVGGEVRALTRLGRLEEARRLAEKQIETLGLETVWGVYFRAYLVGILAEQGNMTGARRYLEQLRQADVAPWRLASAYQGIGDAEKALEAYQRLEDDDWNFVAINMIRLLGKKNPSIREDPGYQKTLRRANRAWGLNPDGSLPEEPGVTNSSTE